MGWPFRRLCEWLPFNNAKVGKRKLFNKVAFTAEIGESNIELAENTGEKRNRE
jgi:hypothetical protein